MARTFNNDPVIIYHAISGMLPDIQIQQLNLNIGPDDIRHHAVSMASHEPTAEGHYKIRARLEGLGAFAAKSGHAWLDKLQEPDALVYGEAWIEYINDVPHITCRFEESPFCPGAQMAGNRGRSWNLDVYADYSDRRLFWLIPKTEA